ncbi:unnamed protein product [Litomosoides sigmodontis]|uniref:Uncharacterized protein n=1 Tax=Litomosoides sigmodontis TaxID=42156 RepID=A0A3P6TS34_LITSI|nr:unnamed protein product [Litomosoides sigmodontis]
MAQGAVFARQGLALMKQVTGNVAHLYGQIVHTMKTNVILRPMYKWWEGRFWLKEESCFVNRGRARVYTYLLLFFLIRSRSAKKAAETEELKAKSMEQIVATALRCNGR